MRETHRAGTGVANLDRLFPSVVPDVFVSESGFAEIQVTPKAPGAVLRKCSE
jgi:hypothetical protein